MKAFAITGLKETGFVEKDERPVGAPEEAIQPFNPFYKSYDQ